MTTSSTRAEATLPGRDSSPPPPQPPAATASASLKEFIWRASALAEAAKAIAKKNRRYGKYIGLAEATLQLGKHAMDPPPELRGKSAYAALELFRRSVYWSLRANANLGAKEETSFGALWEAQQASLEKAGLNPNDSGWQLLASDAAFGQAGEENEADQMALASHACTRSGQLLRLAAGPLRAVAAVKLQRSIRSVLCVILLGLTGLGATWAVSLLVARRDLAFERPWRASSVGYQCHPDQNECGGAATDIFFHTAAEANPWWEVDLGNSELVSSLSIFNRTDCCQEVVLPLIVELSTDGKAYKKVAQRDSPFETWKPQFPKERARFVRLSVPKTTVLHLRKVMVHP